MKGKTKIFMARLMLSVMLAMVLTASLSMVAFAADETPETKEAARAFIEAHSSFADDGTFRTDPASLKTYVKGLATGGDESTIDIAVYVNVVSITGGQVYWKPADSDTISKMATQNQDDAEAKAKVQEISDGLSVKADLAGAAVMMEGFQPIVATITGIVCFMVVVFMAMFTAFDVAYIAFPVFRNKCEDSRAAGGNSFMVKPGKGGNTAESELRWVTNEAQHAVQQATIENGRSPWGIYIKKRIIAYIGLAVVLFILMTGRIEIIVNIALNVIGGIMDQLTNLGA
jgi:hypothetical protein